MKAGIAGAGIMGKLLAFSLQNAGWKVTLFDQGNEDNCSRAAAGLLTHITELEKNERIIYQLGHETITQHWPRLLKNFDEEVYFKQSGSLVLSHPRDKVELSRLLRMIDEKLGEKKSYHCLDQEQIRNLESQITKFQEGYFFPDEGQLDCQTLLAVLEKYLTKISWHKNTLVQRVLPKKIVLKDEICDFDVVFDCRGLGAKSIFHDLRSVRGELIWLHAPDVTITRPIRLMHPRYSFYIAPRPNQIYIVGASEIESHDESEITVRTTLELLTGIYSVHPGFSEARILKMVTQCRPTLANHLPKIKYDDGFVAINGLYRHGYLIAPALSVDVMLFLQQGIDAIHYPTLWEKYTHD